MEIFDNVAKIVRDDMGKTIVRGSKVSIAAACFSMYAYRELKKQLEGVKEFRFIFTSPTFITEKVQKQKREFYIPRLEREKNLYGTEFEVKLKNEMTQKSIAKECADWIRRKAKFKSNVTGEQIMGFMTVDSDSQCSAYEPLNGFTTVDIGCERGNHLLNRVFGLNAPEAAALLHDFDAIWNDKDKLEEVTDTVLENITTAYNENSPELIYFITLYNVFSEFLEDISEDVLPNEATGFKDSKIWHKLYDFQKDAALAIINKLEKYNGCILADSVGLGKTFTALAVVKYYENRNKSVLVLCPKKLSDNWMTYRGNVVNNPLTDDRFRYDVLYHTDLSRNSGTTVIGLPIERIRFDNYDLVVIDESHNFRNGIGTNSHGGEKENRYLRLMNRVIKPGVKTKVLMLSATPVNNRFYDLRNQLALAYEGTPELIDEKLNTSKSINEIFRQAQKAFNEWSKEPAEQRTTENLLRKLDFDFFEVLDSVTIARSRKHIEKYYNTEKIGKFPVRNKPKSFAPDLTDKENAANYKDIYELLSKLHLTIYTPTQFIHESKLSKYLSKEESENFRMGREIGIQRLMSINLLKRMESSVHSFGLTVKRIYRHLAETSQVIENFEKSGQGNYEESEDLSAETADFDGDDLNTDFFTVGTKMRIDLHDMDYVSWKRDMDEDAEKLKRLMEMVEGITPEYDSKLKTLLDVIREKENSPINPGNHKVLVFTAFADTAEYLYENIAPAAKKFGFETALVTGEVEGRTTIPGFKAEMNRILSCFSPISKDRDVLYPMDKNKNIDILIATDCISEGQNLQDSDFCVNYDIHWNPVRIIQRFGRIDRIGSKNAQIQLVNFWPNLTLDEYINLKERVEARMKISVLTSTGDDNPISPEEKGDLEYRREQLKKLQTEVVDLEDMSGGVSIMDLGLNDFRLDLLEYIKKHPDLDRMPLGLHAVARKTDNLPNGVLFVLKNRNNGVNIDSLNRIHPFYMVYVSMEGEIVCDYLNPKKLLDDMRLLCRGKDEPIAEVYKPFNQKTNDGKDMKKISELLSKAIHSIVQAKEDGDMESLFKSGGTSALLSVVKGLDDFELVTFLVVM